MQTGSESKAAELVNYVAQLWDNQDEFLNEHHPVVTKAAFEVATATATSGTSGGTCYCKVSTVP